MPDFLDCGGAACRSCAGRRSILNVHDTFPELFATSFGRRRDDPLVRLIRARGARAARAGRPRDRRHRGGARAAGRARRRRASARVVVMNTPDERRLRPQRARRCPMPAERPDRGSLYHGGLAPRFGVEMLIRAVGHLNGSRERVALRVCGSGEDRDRLAALAAEIAPERDRRRAASRCPFEDIPGELARGAPRRRADAPRPLHRAAAAGQAAGVRAHGPAGGRLAPAGDRALLRRRLGPPLRGGLRPPRWPPPSRTSCTTPPRPRRAQRAPRTCSHRSAGPSSAVAIWRWSTRLTA